MTDHDDMADDHFGEGATISDAVRDALGICVRRYESRAINLRVLADELEEEAAE